MWYLVPSHPLCRSFAGVFFSSLFSEFSSTPFECHSRLASSHIIVPCMTDLFLENFLELRDDGVAHILGTGAAAQVFGQSAVVDGVLDGLLDGLGLDGQAEGVSEHHGDGENGADRVDDALAGNIGCRA